MLLWKFYRAVEKFALRFAALFQFFPEFETFVTALTLHSKAGGVDETWDLAETILPRLAEGAQWVTSPPAEFDYKALIQAWQPTSSTKWIQVWEEYIAPPEKIRIRAELKHLSIFARLVILSRPKYAAADKLLRLFAGKMAASGFDIDSLFSAQGTQFFLLVPLFNELTRDKAFEAEVVRVIEEQLGWQIVREGLRLLELPPFVQQLLERVLSLSEYVEQKQKAIATGTQAPTAVVDAAAASKQADVLDNVINNLDWTSLLSVLTTPNPAPGDDALKKALTSTSQELSVLMSTLSTTTPTAAPPPLPSTSIDDQPDAAPLPPPRVEKKKKKKKKQSAAAPPPPPPPPPPPSAQNPWAAWSSCSAAAPTAAPLPDVTYHVKGGSGEARMWLPLQTKPAVYESKEMKRT